MTSIESVVESLLKGVLSPSTWDYVFKRFPASDVRFSNPPYKAVRLSRDYMLVRVQQKVNDDETSNNK